MVTLIQEQENACKMVAGCVFPQAEVLDLELPVPSPSLVMFITTVDQLVDESVGIDSISPLFQQNR